MKKYFHCFWALMASILAGCGTPSGTYEKAIADYVQTDSRGVWTDMRFKALSLEDSPCTVEDSIGFIRAAFDKKQAAAIGNEKENIEYWEGVLSGNPASGRAESYRKTIANLQIRIDSLERAEPEEAGRYAGRAPTDVLAIVVRCRYRYVMPGEKERRERTETFILSPDGKTVSGKTKKWDM